MSQLAALCLGAAAWQVQAHPIVADAAIAQYQPAESAQGIEPIRTVQYQPQTDTTSDNAQPQPQQQQAKPADSRIVPSPVPEPVHYKLLLIGIALLLFFGHRSSDSKPWRKI